MENKVKFFYKFPNKEGGFEFELKPLTGEEFFDNKMGQKALEEMSTGQSYEEVSRILAQKFKDKILKLDENALGKLILQKAIIYPCIVDKKTDIKDDEIPFNFIMEWEDLKEKLVKKIREISSIFAEG